MMSKLMAHHHINNKEEVYLLYGFMRVFTSLGIPLALDEEYNTMSKIFPNMKIKARIAIKLKGIFSAIEQGKCT